MSTILFNAGHTTDISLAVKIQIKSEIMPDAAGLSGMMAGSYIVQTGDYQLFCLESRTGSLVSGPKKYILLIASYDYLGPPLFYRENCVTLDTTNTAEVSLKLRLPKKV